jgi:uncharacterized protein (DUF885 family)
VNARELSAINQEYFMTTTSANRRFGALVEDILRSNWDFYPNQASALGLHEYDGRLSDVSKDALARRAKALEAQIESLEQVDTSRLSRQNRFDYCLLLSALRKEHFELAELRVYELNPIQTLWHVELSHYIKRSYAPLERRAEALTQALRAVPRVASQLQANLSRKLSRSVLEASIEAYQGIVTFYNKDLTQALEKLSDPSLKRAFDEARGLASQAVSAYVEHLKQLQAQAVDQYAIGEDKFLALLRHGEMVDMPLERLLEVGIKDLERNRARAQAVAAQIDPARPPADVMKEIEKDHPSAEALIGETRDMLESIRRFLIDHDIVTVPSEERCQTKETPSFMRWAFAAMDTPGPLETKATESYYYVTPVEDHWSEQQKEQWLTSFNYSALQIISIHEAYPGHYLQYLHARNAPTRISQIFGSYSFAEGWAHYTEEMMIEQGYGAGDPRIALGQLTDALLRDCRYICAIRMHAQGMTVDEAARFFMDNAYMEELPARKEALRGTFDPMYLNYTLGKLMILRLREDYRKAKGAAFSLKGFHDAFLSYGTPPIPLARQMMLRGTGKAVL